MKEIGSCIILRNEENRMQLYVHLVDSCKKENLFLFFSQKQVFDYLHSNRREINSEEREAVLALSEKFLPEKFEDPIVEFSGSQVKTILGLLKEYLVLQQKLQTQPQIKKATAEDLFPGMYPLP